MMRLISSTTTELIDTVQQRASVDVRPIEGRSGRTLFSNQAVVAVVGVVGITGDGTAPITNNTDVELWLNNQS